KARIQENANGSDEGNKDNRDFLRSHFRNVPEVAQLVLDAGKNKGFKAFHVRKRQLDLVFLREINDSRDRCLGDFWKTLQCFLHKKAKTVKDRGYKKGEYPNGDPFPAENQKKFVQRK